MKASIPTWSPRAFFVLMANACAGPAIPPEPGWAGVAVEPKGSTTEASSSLSVSMWLEASTAQLGIEPFWLAARFEPPPNTHLYWKNPGESGLATTAEFSAPEGFDLSEVRYPGPVSFRSERGASSYGYLGSTALLVSVTPTREHDHATFRARASWLSCRDICVREDGEAALSLGQQAPKTATLDEFVALLPEPADGIESEWVSETEVVLRSREGTRLLEYFPLDRLGVEDRAPVSTPAEDGSLLVELRSQQPPRVVHGVVRAATSVTRYFEVELTRATADPVAPALQ